MGRRNWFAAIIVATIALVYAHDESSSDIYKTRFEDTTWDNTNWRLTTKKLVQGQFQSRLSMANGYIGINVAALGPFFEVEVPLNGDDISGWPLFDRRQTFATIGGFYDEQPTTNGTNFLWLNQYGGESVISGVPHWAGLHVQSGNDVLAANTDSSQISNFSSELDIRAGTLSWSYTWTPSKGSALDIEYQLLVHKLLVNTAAVQLKVTAKEDAQISVIDALNGDCATRTDFVAAKYVKNFPIIWSAVRPNGINNVTAYIYSEMHTDHSQALKHRHQYSDDSVIGGNQSSIAQAVPLKLKAGEAATVWKYIGAASTDAFPDPQNIASTASNRAAKQGYKHLLQSHAKEWRSIMSDDTVEDYSSPKTGRLPQDANVIEQQIIAVTSPFYLLSNTVGENAIAAADNNAKLDINSISVGGLGSDSYAGFIFWDAEVWMAPGLVVTYPQAAKQIARYRVEKLPQAQANILTAYQSSQNETGKFSPDGAIYSWTSGRYGNCTGTGPCFDYEYHLNGDIGIELYNYFAATGDAEFFQSDLNPVYQAIAQMYSDLVTYNETSEKYDLYNATDPDEYANFKDNVGYTMVLMQTHINNANMFRQRFGQAENSQWAAVASKINIPIDTTANIILEYTGMNGTIDVKQADVVLVDDLIDFPNPYTLSDLSFYGGRQSPNGPGMTWGVYSDIANANLPSGCAAYTYDLYGSQPYARAPWFQFSEQLVDDYSLNGGTHPAFPFLTGMGGANRVAVFGYLGLRLSVDSFNVNPNLPPQIPQLKYRKIYWQGWPIQALSNQTHTTLTRISPALTNANSAFANAAIPVTIGRSNETSSSGSKVYKLMPGQTITIPNRQTANSKTIPGNIAQCVSAHSPQDYAIGQFPLSAVDGAVTTRWQPSNANTSSSLVIELGDSYRQISELRFDWAQSPPVSYKVTFSNSSDGSSAVEVASNNNVAISIPYNPTTAADVVPYSCNNTNVTLSHPVWSGKYATLTIKGNQANGDSTAAQMSGTGATVAEWAIVAKRQA